MNADIPLFHWGQTPKNAMTRASKNIRRMSQMVKKSFLNKFERIWTQIRQGIIDFKLMIFVPFKYHFVPNCVIIIYKESRGVSCEETKCIKSYQISCGEKRKCF